jgi:hypothetical protein
LKEQGTGSVWAGFGEGYQLIERRNSRRFVVDWAVKVDGTSDGIAFIEAGVVKNISSNGALLSFNRRLEVGSHLDVFIQLPMKKTNWMKYSAEVLRVESLPGEGTMTAVRFSGATPEFRIPLFTPPPERDRA